MIQRRKGEGGEGKDDTLDTAKTVLKALVIVGVIFWVAPFLLFNTELDQQMGAGGYTESFTNVADGKNYLCKPLAGGGPDLANCIESDGGGASAQITGAINEGKAIMVLMFDVVKYAMVIGAISTIVYMYMGPSRRLE